jgi:hypothetical protein
MLKSQKRVSSSSLNSKKMKKSTLMTGYIASFLFLIGVIFKVLHYQYAGAIVVVGCVLFSLLYAIPLFFERNKQATGGYQKFFNFVVLLMMIFIPAGFLFKLMHWPGAGIILYIAYALLLVGIPLIIYNAVKITDSYKKLNFHNEAIILILLAGFSTMTIYNKPSKSPLASLAQAGHTVMAEMKYNEAKSNDLFAIMENTVQANPAGQPYLEKGKLVKNASDSFCIYITDLQKSLIAATAQTDGNPDSLETIKAMCNTKNIDTILFETQNKAKELKEKINVHTALITEHTNSRGKDIITALFTTTDPQPVEGDTLTWEKVIPNR